MPDNIQLIENLSNTLTISRADLAALATDFLAMPDDADGRPRLPEGNFLAELIDAAERAPGDVLAVGEISWYGEWSTYTWESVFLDRVVPRLRGSADLLVIMENGEYEGWQIRDGSANECSVAWTLTAIPRRCRPAV